MKTIKLALIVLLFSVMGCTYAQTVSNPSTPWLAQAINQSQIIVIAEVLREQPEANPPQSNDLFAHTVWSLKPPSLYTCRVLQTLRGAIQPTFQVHLPRLVSFSYGQAHLDVKAGDHVLLLLQLGDTSELKPTIHSVPLVKIGKRQVLTRKLVDEDIQSAVVGLLLDSLADPTLRTANAFVLQGVVAPEVPAGLIKYINDPDLYTQSAVLGCLAVNQQVAVIPRIAKLVKEASKQDSGTGYGDMVALPLLDFTTLAAVPYLNPLVVDQVYQLRLTSTMALRQLPDEKSIPYLVLALRDPDYQHVIPSSAWRLLHKIVPALGSTFPKDNAFFLAHKDMETQFIYTWWSDELLGKHILKTPEGQQVVSRTLPADASLAVLNTSLFEPSAKLRRTAMYRLQKAADAASIPYLVLALQDPDGTVAYEAYDTLHRLAPSLGEAQGSEAFGANRESVTAPVYAWWSDYLGGKRPVIPMPSEKLIPLPNGK